MLEYWYRRAEGRGLSSGTQQGVNQGKLCGGLSRPLCIGGRPRPLADVEMIISSRTTLTLKGELKGTISGKEFVQMYFLTSWGPRPTAT